MTDQKPRQPGAAGGHSRRDFLRGSGVAAATAVLTGQAVGVLDEAQAADGEPKVLSGTVEVTLKVNGRIARARSSRAARCSIRSAIGWTSPAPSGSAIVGPAGHARRSSTAS